MVCREGPLEGHSQLGDGLPAWMARWLGFAPGRCHLGIFLPTFFRQQTWIPVSLKKLSQEQISEVKRGRMTLIVFLGAYDTRETGVVLT